MAAHPKKFTDPKQFTEKFISLSYLASQTPNKNKFTEPLHYTSITQTRRISLPFVEYISLLFIHITSFRHRAMNNRQRGPNFRDFRTQGSDGTMSSSPVRRAGSNKLAGGHREARGNPRKSSTCLLAPTPQSAAPTGPGSNGTSSLDSLPSVHRVGSAPLNGGSERQSESVQLIKDKNSEVNLKRSLTLVENSGRPPLSRRSYTLVEQSGTSAWI